MIILASSSPSRAQILREAGIHFTAIPLACREDHLQITDAKSLAYQTCLLKYRCALELAKDPASPFATQPFLVADSVASLAQGAPMRKPRDYNEAREMLQSQSHQVVKIITAQILKSPKIELCDVSEFCMQLSGFDEKHLQAYLDSYLWAGKAGAVMVEGFHSDYKVEEKGLLSTAKGLSLEKFLPFFGII